MDEPTIKPRPPRTVVVAVALLTASFIAGFARSIAVNPWNHPILNAFILFIIVAITYAALRALYEGKNWVRWVVAILIVYGCATLALHVARLPGPPARYLYVAQGVVQLVATVLLFLPTSNRWFAHGKA
jgi:hypothetical protein